MRIGRWLQQSGYRFVTVTPATHDRVNSRPGAGQANCLRDIFGWSRPFQSSLLPSAILASLDEANELERSGGLLRSRVRFSTLDDALYVHTAYPTAQPDAVFFGPDTYRFAALIQRTLAAKRAGRIDVIVDVGCGAGAGGIVALKALETPAQLFLTDINAAALRLARVNVALAGASGTSFRQGDLFEPIERLIDLIVANPPYLLDPHARLYRHGGGELGSGLSVRIVAEALPRLAAGGMLILYTGAPIVAGIDTFWETVAPVIANSTVRYEYTELDPDVFGEELSNPAYADVDRIAAVALVIRTDSGARIGSAG